MGCRVALSTPKAHTYEPYLRVYYSRGPCARSRRDRAPGPARRALELDERVKACLGATHFVFPQQSRTFEEWLCNSETYGNFDLLHVTGLVRLDASEPWTFERADTLEEARHT